MNGEISPAHSFQGSRLSSCQWVNEIQVKISGGIFIEIEKLISKCICKWRGPSTAETALEKEQDYRTHATDFKFIIRFL